MDRFEVTGADGDGAADGAADRPGPGMSPMTVAVTHDDELVVVALTGEIDLANASKLEVAILDAVPNGVGGLVLDASRARLPGQQRRPPAAVGRRSAQLARPGLRPGLARRSRCRRVLSLAGVDGAFAIEASVPDAAARLRADVAAID